MCTEVRVPEGDSCWGDSLSGVLGSLFRAPPLPSSSYLPSTHPYTHSGINRAGGCQEGCHVFDLTWFCSHMFSTSEEHPLLPFLSLLSFPWGGVQGGDASSSARTGLTPWAESWSPVALTGCSSHSQGSTCPRCEAAHGFSLACLRFGDCAGTENCLTEIWKEVTSLELGELGCGRNGAWRSCHASSPRSRQPSLLHCPASASLAISWVLEDDGGYFQRWGPPQAD